MPLHGCVNISGMKNAALPILYACVLVNGKCIIENVPDVSDVRMSIDILRNMGADIERVGDETYEIDCRELRPGTSNPELVKKLICSARSSEGSDARRSRFPAGAISEQDR